MSQILKVGVYSPEKPLVETKVREVRVPTVKGTIGILAGHAEMVSEIGLGSLSLISHDRKEDFFVSGGFVKVSLDGEVTVLVDVAERSSDIDFARAAEAEARALDRIKSKSSSDINMGRAIASLERAKARQKLKKRV